MTDWELLSSIQSSAALPQGPWSDPGWDDRTAFDGLCRLLAISDALGERQLVEGIPALMALAPLEDPWDLTQGLRHGIERAVNGDWHRLTNLLLPLTSHDRPGARRWAIDELGLLRDAAAVDALLAVAASDPEAIVRASTYSALALHGGGPDSRQKQRIIAGLLEAVQRESSTMARAAAVAALADLDPEAAYPFEPPPPSPPFMDPTWSGDIAGPDAVQANRRIVRALIAGTLRSAPLDDYVRATGRQIVMTPGQHVYPPREPLAPSDGSAPDWRSRIELWAAAPGQRERLPTGLVADVDLRRASDHEVRARLVSVAPSSDIQRR